jgi:hypothetical protein
VGKQKALTLWTFRTAPVQVAHAVFNSIPDPSPGPKIET